MLDYLWESDKNMDIKLIIWGPHKIIWGPTWGPDPNFGNPWCTVQVLMETAWVQYTWSTSIPQNNSFHWGRTCTVFNSIPILLNRSLYLECPMKIRGVQKIDPRLIVIFNATIQLIVVEVQNRLITYCCCNVVPLALLLKLMSEWMTDDLISALAALIVKYMIQLLMVYIV